MKSKMQKKNSFLYRKYIFCNALSSLRKNPQGQVKTKNMYVDYIGGADALESIPGYRKICSTDGKIHSIFSLVKSNGEELVFIHSGNGIYTFEKDKRDKISSPRKIADIADRESHFCCRGSLAFITDGERLIKFSDGESGCIISENPDVCGCRVMEIYDGRLFLSGNPNLPGDIFYSTPLCSEDLDFPCENKIASQGGGANITAMISTGYGLWIFKELDDGDGGIMLRCAVEGQGYPILRSVCGISAPSGGVMQNNRILFLYERALYAIENPHTDSLRVELISPSIPLPDENERIFLTVWQGYLAICYSGKVILADTRFGGECNIYPIEDIGEYQGDMPVYRYSSVGIDGYALFHRSDEICFGQVMSIIDSDGRRIFYEVSGEKKYLLYPTKERIGGSLFPASKYYCKGDLLWFAGDSCLFAFNNDMRGVCPTDIQDENAISANEYASFVKDKIHSHYYSFASHTPEYIIELPIDDCDYPDLKKVSQGSSLTIFCKNLHRSNFYIDVISDGRESFSERIYASDMAFDDMDFSAITPTSSRGSVQVACGNGGAFYTRQIVLYSKEYAAPFGIKYLSFRYRIKGGEIQK